QSYLQQIADAMYPLGLTFSWDFDDSESIHARHFVIDDRWDILLDRGLDIWQKFDSNNAFAVESGMPEMRRVKQFEITYLRARKE
ncbi:MAG: MIT C-terminal domain-containing protein, partial [Coriobacteriales bacterium]